MRKELVKVGFKCLIDLKLEFRIEKKKNKCGLSNRL